jgi:uncharacterized repeat protein (TIGR04042 family)
MPEMHFTVRWPEGDDMRCYSPSLVVREHLEVGRAYPLAEFAARCRTLLERASERVRARYGFACSAALDQLAAIEARAAQAAAAGLVRVLAFELPPLDSGGGAPEPEPGAASAALAETAVAAAVAVAGEVQRG